MRRRPRLPEPARAAGLAYEAGGQGDSVVFLHGFAGSREDGRALSSWVKGRRLVCPDLPFHGDSRASAVDWAAWPGVLSRFARETRGLRAPLVGYSFGARLALAAAVRDSSNFGPLLLISPHAGLAGPELDERRRRDLADAALLRERGLEAFFERWYANPVFATRRGLAGWQEECERRLRTNAAPDLAEALDAFGLGSQPDLHHQLKKIESDVVVVCGALDPAYAKEGKRIAAGVPRGTYVEVAGAGHAPHIEAPEALTAALRRAGVGFI